MSLCTFSKEMACTSFSCERCCKNMTCRAVIVQISCWTNNVRLGRPLFYVRFLLLIHENQDKLSYGKVLTCPLCCGRGSHPGKIHEQDKSGFKSCLHQIIEHRAWILSPERPELPTPQHERTCIFPWLAGTDLSLDDREPLCNILPFCYLLFKYCLQVPAGFTIPNFHIIIG